MVEHARGEWLVSTRSRTLASSRRRARSGCCAGRRLTLTNPGTFDGLFIN
jgi:hypothetical protein